jgi:hypothetical protein
MENGRPDRGKKEPKGLKFERQRDPSLDGLLTEEEKVELRLQAREDFDKERKKQAADAFYKQALDDERRAGDPQYERVPVFLQLPGSANYIMLDGKQFFTDTVYNDVPLPVATVLIEQMNRAWAHEEVTEVRDSQSRRRWRPPPGIGYSNFLGQRSPRNIVTSSAGMDGVIAQMQRTISG